MNRIAAVVAIAAGTAVAGCAASSATAGGAGGAAAPSAASLRVVSYNIQSGGGNLDRVAESLRALAPDIAALQEVDVNWDARSNFADQAAALGARLGMAVRFAPIYTLPAATAGAPPRQFGVALLSRVPIVRWWNDSLTRQSTQEANSPPARGPGLLEATLDVRGTPVRVLVTHLDYRPDPAVRTTQVAEMVRYLGVWRGPTLVLGDMNAAPDAPELRPLLGALRDASAGASATYPAGAPTKRIDYVLASSHFDVRRATVPDVRSSDHRPVLAELVLAQPR